MTPRNRGVLPLPAQTAFAAGAELAGPVLGIESSCDETAVAVLDPAGRVLAERVVSQTAEHAPYGGVVPEIAARAHLSYFPALISKAMADAGVGYAELGAVGGTAGPGLIGGLIVGSGIAKGIALARNLPFVAVNHLEAHALTPRLPGLEPDGAAFPYVTLLVSGGHSLFLLCEGVDRYVRLGATVDDAAGEAFDKTAKLLGLGWPGGPALERLAACGDPKALSLPRPMLGRPGCDLSFSGLKTAVATHVARLGRAGALTQQQRADVAASFQEAVAAVLADRAVHAVAMARQRAPSVSLLVVSGGVAANVAIRTALGSVASQTAVRVVAPPLRYCGDNAVMIAWAAIERLRAGLRDPLDTPPRPRWPLA